MEAGLTKEIVRRVRKEESRTIWLERTGCVRSTEMTKVNQNKICQPWPVGIMALKQI